MSWMATSAVKAYSEARGTRRLVMIFLAEGADDYGFAWPGYESLAQACRISPRSVMRAIDDLIDTGELAAVERPGRSRIYRMRIVGLKELDAQAISRVCEAASVTPDILSPLTNGAQSVTRTYKNQKGSSSSPPNTSPSPNRDSSQSLEPVGETSSSFEQFWDAYPRRNGKRLEKRKAQAQWQRLKPADRDAALIGVVHYAALCDAGETIAKDAFRWLRDRCFEDWQEPATPQPQPRSQGRFARAGNAAWARLAAKSTGEEGHGAGSRNGAVGDTAARQLPAGER